MFNRKLTIDQEQWLPILDFPGYEVSSLGNVRSWHMRGPGVGRSTTPRMLSPGNQNNYLVVLLCKDKKRYNKLIHRLVLEAFVGPCPEGMEACHGPNFDSMDNRLCNLRWDTKKSNQADRVKNGTDNRGDRSTSAKTNEKDVLKIRERLANKEKARDIARDFGLSEFHVSLIKLRKCWKHI